MSEPFRLPFLVGPPRLVTIAAWDWAEKGYAVRVLRGKKMRRESGIFDEFSAALQFPYYFGENWPAIDECLSDLSWLPNTHGYVLIISDADELLVDDDDHLQLLRIFVSMLDRLTTEWRQIVSNDGPWDHEPVPFSVVLHAQNVALLRQCQERWTEAGAPIGPQLGQALKT